MADEITLKVSKKKIKIAAIVASIAIVCVICFYFLIFAKPLNISNEYYECGVTAIKLYKEYDSRSISSSEYREQMVILNDIVDSLPDNNVFEEDMIDAHVFNLYIWSSGLIPTVNPEDEISELRNYTHYRF